MSALEDLIRTIVANEVDARFAYLHSVESQQLELPLEPACAAELPLASGHTLRCTEVGTHTTHRFAVDL